MPFPGPRPVKAVCPQCNYSFIACEEGDCFRTPMCRKCSQAMEIKPLNNPLLEVLIKNLPPQLRRRLSLNRWLW
jgi:tRNA(Ile2) C34 agmatinyltransferase TiaS